jgi:diguanylate cyclase (GGDEF)-like protein
MNRVLAQKVPLSVPGVCARVHDPAVFAALLAEAAKIVLNHDDDNLCVVGDAETLNWLPPAAKTVQGSARAYCLTDSRGEEACPAGFTCVQSASPLGAGDRIFAALSPEISVALFAWEPAASAGEGFFHGGWTVQRSTVAHLAEMVLGPGPLSGTRNGLQDDSDANPALSTAMRLTALQTEALERLAITDELTGARNRRYVRERLDQECERAARYRIPLSCIMLDVDDFKVVNDSWGHAAGDGVLKELCRRIYRHIRKVDLLARYGGEEFVVLLPQTGMSGAMLEAERIRKALANAPFEQLPPGMRVTASLGVALFDPKTMEGGEDLLKAADTALYRAKSLGKNRCEAFQEKEIKT